MYNTDHAGTNMMTQTLPELLTPEQTADYLQMSVGEVVELLNSGEMPASQIAGKWRIRRSKLDEWIDGQYFQPNSPQILTNNPITSPELQVLSTNNGKVSTNNGALVTTNSAIETTRVIEQTSHSEPNSASKPSNSNGLKAKPKWQPQTHGVREIDKKLQGTVKKFDLKSGHGFIKGDDGRDFHVSSVDIAGWGQSLRPKDRVEFEANKVPQGWVAKKVISLSTSVNLATQTDSKINNQQISYKTQRLYQEALVAKEQKDIPRARRLFEEAIQSGSSLNVFEAYAAMEEKNARRVDSALKILERGIQVFPDAGALYNGKAMLLRKRGELKEAAEVLKKGLNFAPSFTKQLNWSLAIILVELNDIGEQASLEEAYEYANKAKKMGMPLQDDPKYKKLRLFKEQEIGKKSLEFFRAAGIKTVVQSLNDNYSDISISFEHNEFVETYDLKGNILVRCFFKPVQKLDIDNFLNFLRRSTYFGLNNEIGFIVLDNSNQWRDLLYRIIGDSREAIVPIDQTMLSQLQNEDVIATLRQLLDQWLSRRDLFKNNSPVSGRRFFGRETELQNLMRNIDDGQHTGIYGLRKVGKTSLMYQLQQKRPQDLVVYIDLQEIAGTGNYDCAYLYWAISREIKNVLDQKEESGIIKKTISLKLGSKKKYSELDKPEKRNALHFDEDINRVIDVFSNSENETGETIDRKIVITIDELEYMLPITGKHPGFQGYANFFAHLRGISQKTKGKLVSIIAAANPMISEQATWEGRDNPVFQFYRDTFLPPLTKLECDEMLEKLGRGMSVSFNEDSLECIYSETGGHPYITRQLCSHILSQDQSRPIIVTHKLVIDNLDTFLRDKSDVFREILERLDYFPQEKDLLFFIAEGLCEEKDLATLVTEPIDIALRHLMGYQIVDYHAGQYKIKINLLNRWLQRFRL
jgi:excisionase family DNA binding protein